MTFKKYLLKYSGIKNQMYFEIELPHIQKQIKTEQSRIECVQMKVI